MEAEISERQRQLEEEKSPYKNMPAAESHGRIQNRKRTHGYRKEGLKGGKGTRTQETDQKYSLENSLPSWFSKEGQDKRSCLHVLGKGPSKRKVILPEKNGHSTLIFSFPFQLLL